MVPLRGVPARAYVEAMTGDATLVPPTSTQPPAPLPYTATPVDGSATADTSATVRFWQPVSRCQAGLPSYAEQPDPVPCPPEAVLVSRVTVVPPTEVTSGEAAGNTTP